jgi:hypothetical protein
LGDHRGALDRKSRLGPKISIAILPCRLRNQELVPGAVHAAQSPVNRPLSGALCRKNAVTPHGLHMSAGAKMGHRAPLES